MTIINGLHFLFYFSSQGLQRSYLYIYIYILIVIFIFLNNHSFNTFICEVISERSLNLHMLFTAGHKVAVEINITAEDNIA